MLCTRRSSELRKLLPAQQPKDRRLSVCVALSWPQCPEKATKCKCHVN